MYIIRPGAATRSLYVIGWPWAFFGASVAKIQGNAL